MQEIDLNGSVDLKELATSNFNLEIENKSLKSRVGVYISNKVNYKRKEDLEGVNSNLISAKKLMF